MFLFYLKYAYSIMKCWGGHGYGYMEEFRHTETFKALSEVKRVKLAEVMSGAEGAERVKKYSVPMAEDFLIILPQSRWMMKC